MSAGLLPAAAQRLRPRQETGQPFGAGGASGDTRFTLDGGNLAAEYDGSTGNVLRRYVFGPGDDEALLWYEGATMSDRRFLHADNQGSVIAATDSSGAVLNTSRYDEYGIGETSLYGRFGYVCAR